MGGGVTSTSWSVCVSQPGLVVLERPHGAAQTPFPWIGNFRFNSTPGTQISLGQEGSAPKGPRRDSPLWPLAWPRAPEATVPPCVVSLEPSLLSARNSKVMDPLPLPVCPSWGSCPPLTSIWPSVSPSLQVDWAPSSPAHRKHLHSAPALHTSAQKPSPGPARKNQMFLYYASSFLSSWRAQIAICTRGREGDGGLNRGAEQLWQETLPPNQGCTVTGPLPSPGPSRTHQQRGTVSVPVTKN